METLTIVKVATAQELYSIVGPVPRGMEKCIELMRSYTIFRVTPASSAYWWKHYNLCSGDEDVLSSISNDLMVLPNTTAGSKCEFIVADGLYVPEKVSRPNGITLYKYTPGHAVTLDVAVFKASARHRLSKSSIIQLQPVPFTFSGQLDKIGFQHETFEVLCRACFNPKNAIKYIKKESQRLYSTIVSWPVLYTTVNILSCSKIQWKSNSENGSVSADVFSVLKVFPFLVAKRHGIVSQGILTLSPWNASEYMLGLITGYLQLRLQTSPIKNITELIKTAKPKTSMLQEHEHEYLHTLMKEEKQKHTDLLDAVYVKNSSAPPCVTGIVTNWKENWNYKIRFQLAGVLRSVADAWEVDVMSLAETFIEHMQVAGMAKESINHFIISCNRQLTQDTRPCVSRKAPYSVSPHEFWCPFGGGELGLSTCLSKRKFSSESRIPMDEITPSYVWSCSTASL